MTDQKPAGVFVRLPITDEQAQEMYKAYCAAYASSSLTTRGTATQAALLAIGTPFAGGELEKTIHQLVCAGIRNALVSNWSAGVCALHAKADLLAQEVMAGKPEAVAELAARDAEIVRLLESLEEIELGIDALSIEDDDGRRMAASEMKRQALEVVRSEMKALKGPEA